MQYFDTLSVFIAIFIVCVIFAVTLQRHLWRFVWQLNGVRGVLQQPILWALLAFHIEPKRIMAMMCRWRCFFQRPLAIVVGFRILLYIDDPLSIEQVLNSTECLDKTFLQNGFFARKGLLHATGQQWRTRRKQLNPAFSHAIFLSFISTFNAVGDQLLHIFYKKCQTTAPIECSYVDAEDLLSRAVLEVSCLTMLGTATDFTTEDAGGIASAYKKLLEISALRIMKPWLQWDKLFRLLERQAYENYKASNKLVEQFVSEIVERKHEAWLAENGQTEVALKNAANDASSNGDGGGDGDGNGNGDGIDNGAHAESTRKRIFIEQIFHLATLGELTLEDISNETHAMILVSFETVSNSLLIALLLLAMHPECQQKLRKEITTILSNDCSGYDDGLRVGDEEVATQADAGLSIVRNLNVTQLQRMKYLDMIVNESLRLLTTVPINLRHVSGEFRLRLDATASTTASTTTSTTTTNPPISVLVPPQTIIVVDTFNMQRDVEHWGATALKFEPAQHFTSIAARARHSYAFIPFSRGLRTCIGKSYSILLLKVFLVKLISSFEFRTETQLSDVRFIQGISLKLHSPKGIKFRIQPLAAAGTQSNMV